MKTLTTDQILNQEVRHWLAGNGFAVVGRIGDDMCYCVGVGPKEIGKQVFTLWEHVLKPYSYKGAPSLLSDEVKKDIAELRNDLIAGKVIVKETHLVKSNKPKEYHELQPLL